MQTLMVKMRDAKGASKMKEIHVIRSWSESSGAQLFLHSNGVYGYKDESPVKNISEFSIIGGSAQKNRAETWWARGGKTLSEKFYAALERDWAELQKDIIMPTEGDNSDLDGVLYRRRLVKDRRRIAWSPPATWFEWFSTRPEWWGVAGMIELGDFRFERAEPGDVEEGPEEELEEKEKPPTKGNPEEEVPGDMKEPPASLTPEKENDKLKELADTQQSPPTVKPEKENDEIKRTGQKAKGPEYKKRTF